MSRRLGRPRAEVVEQFYRRKAALSASCASFDQGNEWEVERIATEVFTFVHDGGSIVSILSQLGMRAAARFISSGQVNPDSKNLVASAPLIMTEISLEKKNLIHLPCLGGGANSLRYVQFPTWWEKELIYKDQAFVLTRRRLVFSLRHQDGGGHVGQLTDEAYKRLKTVPMFSAQFGNDPPKTVTGAIGANMRQIAWELDQTLDSLGEIK